MLPEELRALGDYRMLIYAVVLIVVMLTTNSPVARNFFSRFFRFGKKGDETA